MSSSLSVLTHWPLGDLKNVIFNLALLIGIFKSSYDDVLRWMPQDLSDDKSTLVQVMAWCHQATSHYLNQCWPRSLMSYGVTRPQWVNSLGSRDAYMTRPPWVQIKACRLFSAKPLSETMITYCQTLRNTLQWNNIWNSKLFTQENENIVCEIFAILSWPQCVKNE